MEHQTKHLYEFDDFCVDVTERQLRRHGEVVAIPPKVFDTLLVLVENRGRILEKDALMRLIWPETFVEESSLTQYIFQLRKALGEDASEHRYIETIPKRGYRFIAEVRETAPADVTEVNPRVSAHSAGTPDSMLNGLSPSPNRSATTIASEPAPSTRSERPYAAPGLPRWKTAVAASMITLLAASAVGALYLFIQNRNRSAGQSMRITRLTAIGKALLPAVSPDGRYVAYVMEDIGRQSVWIRQVATTSNVQIVPAAEADYQGLAFSRDGNYLYYTVYERPKRLGVVHRVPVLGGTAKKIIEDVDSPVTFSPDGERFAFERNYPGRLEFSIIVANADGSNERILATRRQPDYFWTDGPAWSPDGKIIACSAGSIGPNGPYMNIVGVRVADGTEIPLTSQRWARVGQVAWRKDNSGLVATAWQQSSPVVADQIWHLPYPSGEARRITNDLNSYSGVSIDANCEHLVTMQSTKVSHLWVVPGGDADRATQAGTVSMDNYSENLGLSWMPDGRLVFGSRASGNADLWMMDADGSHQKQLTVEPRSDMLPAVSADGQLIAFVSNRNGTYNIWQMNADGSNPKQLTDGQGETYPSLSPDGKWLVYSAPYGNNPVIWKAPTGGGSAVQLTTRPSFRPTVSPDGKLVGHLHMDEQSALMKVAVVPIDGGEPVRVLDKAMPEPPIVNWSSDGRMLTYIETRGGVSNIWGQPVDGSGPARPLTSFKTDRIYRFAWSAKGKNLACERGFQINDVVLISEFL